MRKNLGPGTAVFPTPIFIVGTYKGDGKANAMAAAWGGICSSDPPCMMIAIRKNRCTLENIMNRGAFTINIPSVSYAKETDYFGLISGKKTDKFDVVNLTAEPSNVVDAPLIKEFPFVMECKCIQSTEVGQHMVIIGEIVNMSADEASLTKEGEPDLSGAGLMVYDQLGNSYRLIGEKVEKAFSAGVEFIKKDQKE